MLWLGIKLATPWFAGPCSIHWAIPARASFFTKRGKSTFYVGHSSSEWKNECGLMIFLKWLVCPLIPWSIAACRTFISGLWWCEQRRLDSVPRGFYLLDLEIQPQTWKGKEKQQQKKQTKTWDLKQTKTSLMTDYECMVLLTSIRCPQKSSESRLCTRAGLLLFNRCLTEGLLCAKQCSRYLDTVRNRKIKDLCESSVVEPMPKSIRVTWTQGLNSGSATW